MLVSKKTKPIHTQMATFMRNTETGSITNTTAKRKINNDTFVATRATTATNAFLISVCISDLLIGVFVLPIFIITKLDPNLWSIELCRLFRFFRYFAIMSNTYSNVSIAIERFRCVVLKTKYNYKIILLNIFMFYALSIGMSFMDFNRYEVTYENESISTMNPNGVHCELHEDIPDYEKALDAVFFVLLCSLVPMGLIIVFYALIIFELNKVSQRLDKATHEVGISTHQKKVKESKGKSRVFIKTFVQLITVLLVTQIPYVILSVLELIIHLHLEEDLYFILDLTLILSCTHAFLILIPYRYLLPKISNSKIYNEQGNSAALRDTREKPRKTLTNVQV